jgi:dihydrofolate synthase/folylpolyglutamate synthase
MDFANALRILERTAAESVSARFPGRLDRMRALLEHLDHPERRFKAIHIGGTAGKGSTATMCAAILQAAGFTVGLHTKPHLNAVTERARINLVPVGEEEFAEIFSDMLPALEKMRAGDWGMPSYFELLVALSFAYFARERVDVAVIEVGVGGALDGTNVIQPLVSVITNVGMDHRDVLGETLEEIALDKSGIIKYGVPAVTAAEQPEVLSIIAQAAAQVQAPLLIVKDSARIESRLGPGSYSQTVAVSTTSDSYNFELPLIGQFQVTNAATAILACEQVRSKLPFTPADTARALSALSLPGRSEYYPSGPPVLFDVAHNAEKALALRRAIEQHFDGRRLIFVVAIAEEKDVPAMFEAWRDLPAHFIFTTFDVSHRRSRHSRNLSNIAEQMGLISRAVDDPVEALGVARRMAKGSDLVVVTGSTFLVGLLRAWFLDNVESARHAPAPAT